MTGAEGWDVYRGGTTIRYDRWTSELVIDIFLGCPIVISDGIALVQEGPSREFVTLRRRL